MVAPTIIESCQTKNVGAGLPDGPARSAKCRDDSPCKSEGPAENQHVIARSRKATWQSRGTRSTPKIDGIATPLAGLAMTWQWGAGLFAPGGGDCPNLYRGTVITVPYSAKNPLIPKNQGISHIKCSTQYAERIPATGRAALLDLRQVKCIRHEFASRHCRNIQTLDSVPRPTTRVLLA